MNYESIIKGLDQAVQISKGDLKAKKVKMTSTKDTENLKKANEEVKSLSLDGLKSSVNEIEKNGKNHQSKI